jgi:hypothetical protein
MGIFILPMADFSTLTDLSQQYKHCKETEDKDMTIVDFVTDHLINIDCIFDKHQNGDHQKPHKSYQSNQHNIAVGFVNKYRAILISKVIYKESIQVFGSISSSQYCFQFSSVIFHPPII